MSDNVLITGSHRSGSTWIGKVLAASGEIDYVHEPFNLLHAGRYETPLKYWYEYVGSDPGRRETFSAYLDYFMRGGLKCATDRIIRNKPRKAPGIVLSEIRKSLRRERRKAVKDPIALFSADYFHDMLRYRILVSIRHPAAFAESLKNKDWKHDFTHFTKQKELMDEVLRPFAREIESFTRSERKLNDVIEHAILIWKLVHARILYYKKEYPDWIYVRHEDLSMDPVSEFRKIFEELDIPFNERARSYLEASTGGSSTIGDSRDSRRNVSKWTRKLSAEEIRRIHEGTSGIADKFYTRAEWFGTIS